MSTPIVNATRVEQPRTIDRLFRKTLHELGYTDGLINAMTANLTCVRKFFWIIDNSASMKARDGHIFSTENNKAQFKTCSRWNELVDSVSHNIKLAKLLDAPTSYRLLNHPGLSLGTQVFTISSRQTRAQGTTLEDEVHNAQNIVQNISPNGATPLTKHVLAIREEILSLKRQNLIHDGETIAITIATDGTPTDDEFGETQRAHDSFVKAVKSLYGLGVQLVVRLCTDDRSVVNFWNKLDENIELPLEVLDDYEAEAKEVYKVNPWLTYALPIHRMRELGMHDKMFDKLDEDAFDFVEICEFLRVLFDASEIPDPCKYSWSCFRNAIEIMLSQEKTVYNPIHKKLMPWVDMTEVRKVYNRRNKSSFRFW